MYENFIFFVSQILCFSFRGLKILLVSAQLNVPFKCYNKKYFGSNVMGGKVL